MRAASVCACPRATHLDALKGTAHQHRVRSRWGSAGRIDLIGTLCLVEGEAQRLEYSLIEGSCRSAEVKHYLVEALAEQAQSERASLAWSSWTTRRFTLPG